MGRLADKQIYFAADCVQQHGQCTVVRENILFLDDGNELAAVGLLQLKCGSVAIIPDLSRQGQALLYHTSCERMSAVLDQIFADRLEAPVSLTQYPSEMSVGELQRRCVTLPYDDCRVTVDAFDFRGAS